jgi:hypothetical protein
MKGLAAKPEALERKYDAQFRVVFAAIRKLMEPAAIPPGRRIGFTAQGLGEVAAPSQQLPLFTKSASSRVLRVRSRSLPTAPRVLRFGRERLLA